MVAPNVLLANDAIGPAEGSATDLLTKLLIDVGVLPDPADTPKSQVGWAFTGTPPSVAILEAGATASAKGWSTFLGLVGGATAATAAVTHFWNAQSGAAHVVILAAAGLIMVSTILAIAYMVVGDIKGRSQGAVALYETRKTVTLEYLRLTYAASKSPPPDPAAVKPGKDLVTRLAIQGARAQVQTVTSLMSGHLTGIREAGGSVEVQWTDLDGTTQWCDPSALTIQSYTF